MQDRQLASMLACAIGDGMDGAALVDRRGNAVASAGTIADEAAMALAALAAMPIG